MTNMPCGCQRRYEKRESGRDDRWEGQADCNVDAIDEAVQILLAKAEGERQTEGRGNEQRRRELGCDPASDSHVPGAMQTMQYDLSVPAAACVMRDRWKGAQRLC